MAGVSVIVPFIIVLLCTPSLDFSVFLGLVVAFWVLGSTVKAVYHRLQQRGLRGLTQAYLGMVAAHCGVAATVIGISVSLGTVFKTMLKWRPAIK